MLKRTNYLKSAVGLFAAVGLIQAAPVTLTSLWNYSGNQTWQDIKSVSASYVDGNNNGILEVGEAVTFSVTMEKDNWGTHDFDALKVWVDELPGIEAPYYATDNFQWDYNNGVSDWQNGYVYSYKDWTGGTRTFNETVTFNSAGDWGFAASVMCSRDLSGLSGTANDVPDAADWNAWSPDIHKNAGWLQGEDEAYKITVSQKVPEPGILSLIGCGILSLAFIRRRK